MRIDSHQHYWDIHRFNYFWMNDGTPTIPETELPASRPEADLRTESHRWFGACQASHTMEETWWSLELAESERSILGVVAWVDLTDPKVGDTLDKMQGYQFFKGVRHLVQG